MPKHMRIYAPAWEVLSGAEFNSLYNKGEFEYNWDDWSVINTPYTEHASFYTLSWNEETKRWEASTVKQPFGTLCACAPPLVRV